MMVTRKEEGQMTKVAAGITTSLDGYITGPNDGPGRGLGGGGERLHYWVFGGPWSYDEGAEGRADARGQGVPRPGNSSRRCRGRWPQHVRGSGGVGRPQSVIASCDDRRQLAESPPPPRTPAPPTRPRVLTSRG